MHWRSWDNEHLVYNCGSGDTHLLDELSAEILRKIERAPATVEELQGFLTHWISEDAVLEIPGFITDLLKELQSLCLIEEVVP